MSDESVFADSPQEFFQEYFANDGSCDAQSIVPVAAGYICHCTCGRWDVKTPDRETGLQMAHGYTREITERELAKLAR